VLGCNGGKAGSLFPYSRGERQWNLSSMKDGFSGSVGRSQSLQTTLSKHTNFKKEDRKLVAFDQGEKVFVLFVRWETSEHIYTL
jgi:hypothetical protein